MATRDNIRGSLNNEYCLPKQSIARIVDAEETPQLLVSPHGKFIAYLYRSGPVDLHDISEPEVRTAGLRLSTFFTKSFARRNFYTSLRIETLPIKPDPLTSRRESFDVIPHEEGKRKLAHFKWNCDGDILAFSECFESEMYLNTYLVPERKLIRKKLCLNDTLCSPLKWVANRTLLVLKAANSNIQPPSKPRFPKRPIIRSHDNDQVKLAPTFQDLIKDDYDENLFKYYTTSKLVAVSVADNDAALMCKDVNGIEPGIYVNYEASPNGLYLKLDKLRAPFSRIVPYRYFGRRTTVHKLLVNKMRNRYSYEFELVREIAKVDAAEDIFHAHDTCRKGRRFCWWSEGHGAMLCFVEALDDGNPNNNSKYRDCVCSLHESDAFATKVEMIRLQNRFAKMSFFETGDLAVVSEKWWETKLERKWLLNFQGPDLLKAEKVLFSERSYEDKYSDPGNIQYGYSQLGTKCPLQMRRDLGQQKVTIFLYNDEGAGEEGYVPFLNIVEIDLENLNDSDRLASEKSKGNTNTVKTGIVTQIWESNHEAGKFERIHAVLNNSGSTLLSGDSLRVILSQETPEEPPNYYLYDLNFLYVAGVVKKVSDESAVRITNFKHPYPAMKGYSKHIIKYKRPLDGVTLSSTLYLPKGYSFDLENIQTDRKKSKLKKEKRLPLLFWAYPLQYNAASAAGQLRDSPFRFSKVTPFKSPLVWLTLGFAVLDGPSMPIIATGDKSSNANDTYVEQLVSSAEAAVDYVCNGLGICDSTRVAVGGHSYGAFMVANLLIHSKNLFCCGIARSGAYNRTMTPFGFQTERRSFWKVPKIYTKMSPFFTLHKDMRPILLIHGAEDENRGTYTDQSVRMFAALRSIGVVSRLVVLPYEGHRYRARESIMHCLAETEFWLRKYCVDKRKYSTSYDVAPDELRSATAPIATIATHIQPGDSQVNL